MLASPTNVFFAFSPFFRHRICSIRHGCLSFPTFRSTFCRHSKTTGTLKKADEALPAADSVGIPTTVSGESTILRTLSSRQKEQVSLFVNALLEWNERMNLTAVTQESEVMTRHVEDSLALLPPLRRSYLSLCCPASSNYSFDGLKLVDVGSGCGLPGLIIAIACPTWKVTLLESMHKRCLFLEHVVRLTGLSNVEVLRERSEKVGHCLDCRELFDVAVAIAVAEMRVLAEYCLPLVRVGGLFIAAKGHSPQEEVKNSEKAVQLMGGSLVELCYVESHSPLGQRTAVICFKDHTTPKKYPRDTGIPSKMPL